jgi:hypothetical protein
MDSRAIWFYCNAMAKTVEIELPDDVYDAVEAQARSGGLSVAEYLVHRAAGLTRKTSVEALRARLRAIPPVDLGQLTAADLIREGREERTDEILDAIGRR